MTNGAEVSDSDERNRRKKLVSSLQLSWRSLPSVFVRAAVRDSVRAAIGLNSLHGLLAWGVAAGIAYQWWIKPELEERAERRRLAERSEQGHEVQKARVMPSGKVVQNS